MPRRTIVIGRQPSSFDFQDDFGPLNNGLAYAAGQWLASGRDRAQIEMQRDAQMAEDERRSSERAQAMDFRNQDLELRRLALGQQDQQRTDALEERRRMSEAQAEHNANVLRETRVKNAADAASKWRDDIGAVGKYAFDWMRGGNPSGIPKAPTNAREGSWRITRDPISGEEKYFRTTADGALETIDNETGEIIRRGGHGDLTAQTAPASAPQITPPAPTADDSPGFLGRVWDNTKSGAEGLWDLATGGSFTGQPDADKSTGNAPVVVAPSVVTSAGSGQDQARNQFMAGAGGWGTLAPSWVGPNNGAPNEDAIIAQRVQALNPDDRAAFNRILASGDQKRIAAARARILAAGN